MLAKQALRRPVALGAARACSSSATSGRPGARAAEMEKAADKVQSGKNAWQKTVGGIVDAIRPITSALAPTIMPILDAPYQRGVRNAVNIDDLQAVAERRAHAMVYGYLAGGADAERSLRRSVAAFNDVELRHAVLHGVGHNDMDMRTTILGHEAQLPFFVTSCAGQRMFHADGEVATAKAAKKHGCFMALSQLTTSTFEDVREAHPDGAKALQLYVWRDRVLLKAAQLVGNGVFPAGGRRPICLSGPREGSSHSRPPQSAALSRLEACGGNSSSPRAAPRLRLLHVFSTTRRCSTAPRRWASPRSRSPPTSRGWATASARPRQASPCRPPTRCASASTRSRRRRGRVCRPAGSNNH